MRILVTGASGFVGRALLPRLAASSHEVIGAYRARDAAAPGASFLWDMGLELPPLPAGLDAIVHLAQSRNYRRFPEDALELFRVNVAATARLLERATASGVRRFVLASSGAVYEPFDRPLVEDTALKPSSYHAASKLAAEIIAAPYARLFTLATLRIFFPYGPGQKGRLVPDLIDRVRTGRPVHVAGGDGGLRFSPTYVGDLAEIIATAVTDGWSGTFNVAAPKPETIRSAADLIGAIVGSAPCFEPVEGPAPEVVPDLGALSARYDMSRFVSFEEGLRLTLAP